MGRRRPLGLSRARGAAPAAAGVAAAGAAYGTRYEAGHVEEGGRHLYVTAGVGTSGYPVRLLAPPEIVVLRLRSAAG